MKVSKILMPSKQNLMMMMMMMMMLTTNDSYPGNDVRMAALLGIMLMAEELKENYG